MWVWLVYHYFIRPSSCSSHLRSEVEVLNGKLERVNLSKSMAESKLSDFDRYKAMIELEMTELIARHKTAITEKMARAAQVRLTKKWCMYWNCLASIIDMLTLVTLRCLS